MVLGKTARERKLLVSILIAAYMDREEIITELLFPTTLYRNEDREKDPQVK
jgi:hypothetical protein